MKNFEFINAPTLSAAVDALAELGDKAQLVAGGTNVMVDIRDGKINNKTLVSIRDIPELKGITYEKDEVRLGAMATLAEMSQSDVLKEHAPCLYAAANVFADPTTNHSATVGGNVGNASASGDTIPPLLVLDAVVHAKSKKGERQILLSEFIVKNGKTVLESDELITHLTFKSNKKTGFMKLGPRRSMCISIATVGAYVDLGSDGTVKDCRIALGSVGPKTVRGTHTEKALMGKKLNDETFALIAEEVQKDINPRDPSVRATASYRRSVVPVLVKRAINMAAYGDCKGEA